MTKLAESLILVVIPTFNEKENIASLAQVVSSQDPRIHVLVVDDNSPDGTAAVVRPLTNERIHLVVRTQGKSGRGSAVRAGFEWGLKSDLPFEYFVEMDSDFSHRPVELKTALKILETAPKNKPVIVLGSRYQSESKIVGWPASRRVFSRVANILARTLIGNLVTDFTNGYRLYNRKTVELILKAPQKYKGYIYLSEVLCELVRNGAEIKEFPTIFENRTRGVSNTTSKEVRQALGGIFTIAYDHRLKQLGLR